MPFYLGRADRFKPGWLPVGRLILVDDHRSYPFVKIMPKQQARDYAEFTTHALGEIEIATAPQLLQRDFEAGRRLRPDRGRREAREVGIRPLAGDLRVEPGQDALHAVPCKQPIDDRP